MTSYKTHCEKNAKKIDDFLTENPDLNPENLQVLKELNADLKKQFKRMEISWFSMMDEIEDAPTHTALEKIFNDVDDYVTKTLGTSQKAISGKTSRPTLEPLRDTSRSTIRSSPDRRYYVPSRWRRQTSGSTGSPHITNTTR